MAVIGAKRKFIRQAKAFQGRVDQRAGTVEDELTLDPHVERALILLEFLGVKTGKGGQAKIDAVVAGQVLRRPRLGLRSRRVRRRSP
jgi:hypothetical protein